MKNLLILELYFFEISSAFFFSIVSVISKEKDPAIALTSFVGFISVFFFFFLTASFGVSSTILLEIHVSPNFSGRYFENLFCELFVNFSQNCSDRHISCYFFGNPNRYYFANLNNGSHSERAYNEISKRASKELLK